MSKAITANTVAGNYSIMAAASGGSNPTTTFVNLTNTPAAAHHFDVTAPGSVTAGTPFTVTVTARDLYNNVATGYLGISHFTSSDPCEALPNDYAFTITDNGVHTFSNMVTLWRGGNQNVTVRDAMNSTITGGATVNVTPVYVVSNSNDNGPGSLRQAILTANCNPGADTITFAIGTGVQTINLLSPLPAITDPVVIDGSTQPGYAGQPLIELNGASAGANANGLTISAGSSVVKSLVINRFSADGIWLSGSGGDVVQGNYIGTNAMGTAALGNIQAGILISNVGNNIIGGTTTATRNVISGNGGEGIDIVGAGASNNLVQGDYIGTNAAGTAALPNQSDGVLIQDAPNNTIGGTAVGAGNVISGNNRNGVDIRGSSATSNLVAGNSIGTNRDGNAPLANAATGVAIDNAPNNTVGGTDRDPGVCNRTCNVIAGNTQNGVLIINPAATGNMVQGNLIGTNAAGTAPVGNGDGVYVAFGAVGDLIGGTSAGSRNIISGNQREGVHIQNPGGMSAGDLVQGNYIGLDITGTLPLSNVSHGVALLSGWNTIGGSAAGARNVISANGAAGIIMFGNAVGNTVRGNWIGTQADGQSPLGNGLHGVWINGAGGNSIISNTIAFSGGNGVRVDAGTGNAIQGNVMFGDTDLGIHLVNGGNDDQAAPVIARAVADTVATRFKGTLSSTPDTAFTLEFFANRVCHPSGYGEAEIRLGTVMVTTDGEGQAPWSFRLDYPLPVGYFVSATATSAATNDTSEFAACVAVTGLGVRPWGTKSQKLGQDVRFPGQALARADALPSARSRKAFAIVVRADATTLECYKNGPEMTGRRSAPARTGTRGISGHGIPVDGGEGVLEALSGADLDAFFAASICRPSGVGQRGPV